MELTNVTTLSNASNTDLSRCDRHCRMILISLYSVVLLGGAAGAIAMSYMMLKRNSQSIVATIVLNIIVLHSILLFSLPFRLSYYVLVVWEFGSFTCRLVSSIIYGHMYFTFVFYVAIIISRLLMYFKKLQTQFQKYHVVVLSIIIWLVGSVIFLPIFFLQYGTNPSYSEQQCFEFYKDLKRKEFIILNYSMIVIMMTTVVTLFLIQMWVIVQLVKALWPDMWTHQEYRAQIKSFFFLLIIVVCFIPHHAFRIHFIQHYSETEDSELVRYNEIFVALTTACCLDMLCFVGGVLH
ncbi:probable G-protein coupled receptor 141 [Bubalus kerabau]|uniref:probable G-protein coupled receptor 141 n=1 Tax=Bubalus bubalis TaxID=89462 RepID=UPI00042C9514|nr:probable G-protein coupled receptor 141 [Bubalus bubalis]XP_055445441.1 probable G-protein coupled receptor 141 [Bubalus carabanensis]